MMAVMSTSEPPTAWQDWYDRRTSTAAQWPVDRVLADKQARGLTVSVVLPARDEQDTVGAIVARIHRELVGAGVVDELVVMDSFSTDGTARVARDAGAAVHRVQDVLPARPDLAALPGKGDALWRAQFVTTGDLLVCVDADVTDFVSTFVTGLVGPLLADPDVQLVKGFYDRVSADDRPGGSTQGGRVTELMARPLLASRWPELSAVRQPLSGEWAIRRHLMAELDVPVGYGVELAVLIDTLMARGRDAIAQVDLGRRTHRHQEIRRLGVMAAELLAVADARAPLARPVFAGALLQVHGGRPVERPVPTGTRPAAASVAPSVAPAPTPAGVIS